MVTKNFQEVGIEENTVILFPIKTDVRIIGEKPIKVDKRNLDIEISNNDKIIFCTINGSPGINLKIIRYSSVE